MKMPRTKEDWWNAVLHQLWMKVALAILSGGLVYVLAQGKTTLKREAQIVIMDTVKPSLDSMKMKIDTLSTRCAALARNVQETQDVQREFFGAMMEVVPGLKKAVQDRGKQNETVEIKKAETDKLLHKLTEK